jgi:hypothetical protein
MGNGVFGQRHLNLDHCFFPCLFDLASAAVSHFFKMESAKARPLAFGHASLH